MAGTQLGSRPGADLLPDNMLLWPAAEKSNKWSATVTREPDLQSTALEGLSLQLYNTVEDIFFINIFIFYLFQIVN